MVVGIFIEIIYYSIRLFNGINDKRNRIQSSFIPNSYFIKYVNYEVLKIKLKNKIYIYIYFIFLLR